MIVKTVDRLDADLRLILWQFDSFAPLTPTSPEVVNLRTTLQQANAQKPLGELDVAAELTAWNSSVVVRGHSHIRARTGKGEVSRQWNAGQIVGNAPGRPQIAALVAAGVVHISAQWGQA